MAETPKKAKTPAKPRTTTGAAKAASAKEAAPKNPSSKILAKKRTVAEQVTATTPSREEIARLAQQFWAERGHQDGLAEQDWLRAERELITMAS